MGRSNKQKKSDPNSRNWKLILAAIIPVWGIVMFVGWFVISALVPMLDKNEANQIANEAPEKAILDFNTASGGKNDPKSKKKIARPSSFSTLLNKIHT